jgi:hypothetical protein
VSINFEIKQSKLDLPKIHVICRKYLSYLLPPISDFPLTFQNYLITIVPYNINTPTARQASLLPCLRQFRTAGLLVAWRKWALQPVSRDRPPSASSLRPRPQLNSILASIFLIFLSFLSPEGWSLRPRPYFFDRSSPMGVESAPHTLNF